jgi:hypothetical protein
MPDATDPTPAAVDVLRRLVRDVWDLLMFPKNMGDARSEPDPCS